MEHTTPLLNHRPLPPPISHKFLAFTFEAPHQSASPRLADLDMRPGVRGIHTSLSLLTYKPLVSWNQGSQQEPVVREDTVPNLRRGSGWGE